jgi:hypothetical protein
VVVSGFAAERGLQAAKRFVPEAAKMPRSLESGHCLRNRHLGCAQERDTHSAGGAFDRFIRLAAKRDSLAAL